MTKINKNENVSLRSTAPRATPAPTSRRFRQALSEGASTLMQGVESVSSFVPGGSAISAAVRGATGTSAAGVGSSPSVPGTVAGATATGTAATGQNLVQDNANQTMELIKLQQEISREQRQYTAVSNVMKARHDTAKGVINNVR